MPDDNRPNSNDIHLGSSAQIVSPVVHGSTISPADGSVAAAANASAAQSAVVHSPIGNTPMGGVSDGQPASADYSTQKLESLLRNLRETQNLMRGTLSCLFASGVCTFLWITIAGFVRWRASPLAIVVGAVTGMTMARLGRGMTPRYMWTAVFIAGLGIAVSLGVLQRRTVANYREVASRRNATMSAGTTNTAKTISNVDDSQAHGAGFDEHDAIADREFVSAVAWRARDMLCVAAGLCAAYLLSPRRVTDDELTDILRV